MTPSDVVAMFFAFAALQPVLRQRFLEASRQRLIAKIERKRNSRVILLVHRQETMSILGFPVFRYIEVNDCEEVLRAIQMTDPQIPLDLVLHTPSGLDLASQQIARAVEKRKGRVTVVVPHRAMSGAALIALAAHEIVMCECAVLAGKLDGLPPDGEITFEALRDLGLPVRSDIPAEFLDLMNLYPQGVRHLTS